MKKVVSVVLAVLFLIAFASCGGDDGWDGATYKKDTALGEGAKTFTLDVVDGEHRVTFTVSTDEETLGGALLSLGLIAGEQGAYGIYVKTVNGILADYDVDGTYWAVSKDGVMLQTGIDAEPVASGAHYAFERSTF